MFFILHNFFFYRKVYVCRFRWLGSLPGCWYDLGVKSCFLISHVQSTTNIYCCAYQNTFIPLQNTGYSLWKILSFYNCTCHLNLILYHLAFMFFLSCYIAFLFTSENLESVTDISFCSIRSLGFRVPLLLCKQEAIQDRYLQCIRL